MYLVGSVCKVYMCVGTCYTERKESLFICDKLVLSNTLLQVSIQVHTWSADNTYLEYRHHIPGVQTTHTWSTDNTYLEYRHHIPGVQTPHTWSTDNTHLEYRQHPPGVQTTPTWSTVALALRTEAKLEGDCLICSETIRKEAPWLKDMNSCMTVPSNMMTSSCMDSCTANNVTNVWHTLVHI